MNSFPESKHKNQIKAYQIQDPLNVKKSLKVSKLDKNSKSKGKLSILTDLISDLDKTPKSKLSPFSSSFNINKDSPLGSSF